MEFVNNSSKLVAQAMDSLKYELKDELPDAWNSKQNIKDVIELLEDALDNLSKSI